MSSKFLMRMLCFALAGGLATAPLLQAEEFDDKTVVPQTAPPASSDGSYMTPQGSSSSGSSSTVVVPGGTTYGGPDGSSSSGSSSTVVVPGGTTYGGPDGSSSSGSSSTVVVPGGGTYGGPDGSSSSGSSSTVVVPGGTTYGGPDGSSSSDSRSSVVVPGGGTVVDPDGSSASDSHSTVVVPGGTPAMPGIPVVPLPSGSATPGSANQGQSSGNTPGLLTPGKFIPLTPLTPDGKTNPKRQQRAGSSKFPSQTPGGKADGSGSGSGGGKADGSGSGSGGGKADGSGSGSGGGKADGSGSGSGGGKSKKGDPLRIPPAAAKSGDLSFLEGCWRGTRPEYATKRTIIERFCFDAKGKGKRTIIDPGLAGECYGATSGKLDSSGSLTVTSENGFCTSGHQWAPAHMICKGEGNQTPCYWQFDGNANFNQSYKIPFVRE